MEKVRRWKMVKFENFPSLPFAWNRSVVLKVFIFPLTNSNTVNSSPAKIPQSTLHGYGSRRLLQIYLSDTNCRHSHLNQPHLCTFCVLNKQIIKLKVISFTAIPPRNYTFLPQWGVTPTWETLGQAVTSTRVTESEVKYPTFQNFRLHNIKGMKIGC